MIETIFKGSNLRIVIMTILLGAACFLTYFFHAVLEAGTAFTHFFYIPIIFASLWWKRKGLFVAIFLAVVLILSHIFLRLEALTQNDYFRSLMFIVIAFVVAVLSEQIAKTRERMEHLNLVLRSIRSVNQLLVREKDREGVVKGVCNNLIKTRGYYNVWLALLDDSGKLLTYGEAGLGKDFLPLLEWLKRGELTACGRKALKQSEVVVTEAPPSTCTDCPLADKCGGRGGITIRLEHGGKVYGLLCTSIPTALTADEQEQSLFKEVAGDIAFALHSIGIEEERQRAEEALRGSEEKLRLTFESVTEGISVTDLDVNIVQVNETVVSMHGYRSKEELIGRSAFELIAEKDHARALENLKKTLEEGHVRNIEYTFLRKDGNEFPAESSAAVLKDASGNPIGLVAITRDITERYQAQAKVRQAAKEWRTTFDSITDLVSIHDKDFRLVRVNKVFADTFKMKPKEIIGKTCYEMVHRTKEPPPNCPHKKTLETKKPVTREFFELSLGIHLEVTTSPIFNEKGEVVASVHVARDITERKRMEEQLIITDRLASVGELASGIAHELNNPLTSIIGFSQLLLGKDVSSDVKRDVRIIYREAQRTAEVVKNLLAFARKHTPVKQLVNINSIIEKVLELRAYEQRVSNIEVITQFAPDLPEVMADYFQLQQVFLNIIINAEYFMIEAHQRGTLTIITGRVENTIKVIFSDNGPGIAKENLGHLFDPFFTTKEVGKGTGLGLSICHGIVTGHGGRMYAESKMGKGATFVMELPILMNASKEGGDT